MKGDRCLGVWEGGRLGKLHGIGKDDGEEDEVYASLMQCIVGYRAVLLYVGKD